MSVDRTYTVTVVGGNPSNHPYHNFGSSNKYAIDGSTATADVTLYLAEGKTYRFDQSDSSNSGHPLRFSTTANGTHSGGSEYTTGVTTNGTPGSSGAYTQITVAADAPTLYYYCTNHSGMGWTANTPIASYARTFNVTVVVTGSGNKYVINGVQQDTVYLAENSTYIFDQSDSSNSGHPFRFSTTSGGTHSGGDEYTTGVTTSGTPGSSGAHTQITVANNAPTLYYYCSVHSGMGGTANTPTGNTWGLLAWNDNTWGSQDGTRVSPTGLSASSSIGSVTVSAEINTGWGRAAWNDDAWGIAGDVLLDGQQVTASVGSLSPADVMGLTGVSATASVGSPTVVGDITEALTGVSATSSVGSITPADVMGLTGVSSTSSVGSITPADVMGLTGVSSTTSVGTLSVNSNPTVDLSGVSATSSVGSITVTDVIGLTGVSATSAVGSLTPADVMGLTGVSATASVAAFGTATGFGIQAYQAIDTGSNTSYTDVTGKAA
tara:strand:+ start:214 stop:1689 length:1476 start_codon:yes stop_codon:yes gene_type:complete